MVITNDERGRRGLRQFLETDAALLRQRAHSANRREGERLELGEDVLVQKVAGYRQKSVLVSARFEHSSHQVFHVFVRTGAEKRLNEVKNINKPSDVIPDELKRRFSEFGTVVDVRINREAGASLVSYTV